MASSSEKGPSRITLRAYQVGFGDCFLLTFHYGKPKSDRHVLIDFGSTEKPEGAPPRSEMLWRIAEDIRKRCGDRLEAVVATHRHADHINGFTARDDAKGSGDVIRACNPKMVLEPWTENKDAAEDPLLNSLHTLHAFSWQVRSTELKRLLRVKGYNEGVLKELRRFAANNAWTKDPANFSAVANLRTMSPKPLYLSYGQSSGLNLPGVDVFVLGPPTLQQSQEILKQRATHPDEFWQLLKSSSPVSADLAPLFDSPATRVSEGAPQQARWLIRRLSSLRGEQLLEMVRILDDVLNNTSLILLFKVGDKKLLFPGDAQWENWSYALKQPGIEDLLKGATLYKVGHHGSRNATPKSLWKLIDSENLQSVVSTKPERHGHAKDNTEVPRATLIKELDKHHHLFSTQDLGWSTSADDEPPSKAFTFPTSAEPPS